MTSPTRIVAQTALRIQSAPSQGHRGLHPRPARIGPAIVELQFPISVSAQPKPSTAANGLAEPSAPAVPASVSPAWGWYAVHTHPRKEGVALENLQRQGFESYLPLLRVQKVRRGRAVMVDEPMFPRYLFVRLDSSVQGRSWAPIRSTLGVRALVQFGGRPARVLPELIDWLRDRERHFDPLHLFEPGDAVTVIDGPFKGLEALYQGVDGEHRALILLEILSKPVRVALDAGSLVRI